MLIPILFAAEIFGHQKPFQTTYYLIIERVYGFLDHLSIRVICRYCGCRKYMSTGKCFVVKIT